MAGNSGLTGRARTERSSRSGISELGTVSRGRIFAERADSISQLVHGALDRPGSSNVPGGIDDCADANYCRTGVVQLEYATRGDRRIAIRIR